MYSCEFCYPLHISSLPAHLEKEQVWCGGMHCPSTHGRVFANTQERQFCFCCGCSSTHLVGNDLNIFLSPLDFALRCPCKSEPVCVVLMLKVVRDKYGLWVKHNICFFFFFFSLMTFFVLHILSATLYLDIEKSNN